MKKLTEANRDPKHYERIQNREDMVDNNIDLVRFFELAKSEKFYVNRLKLHGIIIETLLKDTSDSQLNGSMVIGLVERKTNNRFRNMDDFESCINALDVSYNSDDVTFSGHVHKLITPKFKVVKRIAYCKVTNYMKEIVPYKRQICYIPTCAR